MDDSADVLLKLLRRLQDEGVRYILVGGHAVRLNGFLRSTEDIDLLLPSSIENGRRVIRALSFLPSAGELRPEWFESAADEPEYRGVAEDQGHAARQGPDRPPRAVRDAGAHPRLGGLLVARD